MRCTAIQRMWAIAFGATFVLITLLVSGVVADDPPKAEAPRAKIKAKANVSKAKAAIQARRKQAKALQKERTEPKLEVRGAETTPTAGKESTEELLERLGRPRRTVTPPTIKSADLDHMIEETVAAQNVAPAKLTSDEVFLRRVYLDVIGKTPTPDDIVRFVNDKDPKKRAKLIDRLLESKDHARNWARYWRDVIAYHATAENPVLANFPKLEEWLAAQLEQNRAWDEIVRDILTATGENTENGATVMIAAHSTNQRFQPIEMAGEVSRVFMGIQIACAQCHDHPTDSWKREQFHEFTAFFAGTQSKRKNMPQEKGRLISDQPRPPRYTMPDLKDPQRQIPIQPKFFLASSRAELPRELNSAQLRALAASYVTGQDNPWFAMAYVNRVWYELMGDSFYSPVDDMGPERDAVAAPILDALATQWAAGGFDVRWLFRTLLNTKAYQREARSTQSENGRKPMAANCSSRLRSDQLLDAITRVLEIPENGPGGRAGQAAAAKSQVQGALAAGRPFNGRNVFNVVFGVDPSLPKEDVMGTIPQALFLMNGPAIQGGISAIGNTVLGRILAQNPDNLAALTALYLQVLSRRPNAAEIKTCGEYIQRVGNRREAFEDILWSLINSTEFLSRR